MTPYKVIEQLYADHGYKFYKGRYALNIGGIRMGYDTVDEFNDVLFIAYIDDFGNEVCLFHKGTTKPGLYWLKNKKGNKEGTAILKPGQYLNCWYMGQHNGKYDALRQKGMPFKVWRDGNSDSEFDINGATFTNVTGLNMHTASFNSVTGKVGAYSAGCQVRKHDEEHEMVMAIILRCLLRRDLKGRYYVKEIIHSHFCPPRGGEVS